MFLGMAAQGGRARVVPLTLQKTLLLAQSGVATYKRAHNIFGRRPTSGSKWLETRVNVRVLLRLKNRVISLRKESLHILTLHLIYYREAQ